MKIPRTKEEFLVWPPLATLSAVVVAPTVLDSIRLLHSYIPELDGASVLSVYIFSVGMGVGLSLKLHGKYWLGFGWLAFLSYLIVQAMRAFPESPAQKYTFLLFGSLALMFASLSATLYAKRKTVHAESDITR